MKKLYLCIILLLIASSAAFAQKKIYEVSNTKEFLDAIGPDRTIVVNSGTYDLSDYSGHFGKYYYYQKTFEGSELLITDVNSLKIIGTGFLTPEIITQPVDGNVLCFSYCNNIIIENIEAGHGAQKGECTGGVLKFNDCSNIRISDCILYGSGTEGITCDGVSGLVFENSVIKRCTYGIMTLENSSSVLFDKCEFFNNVGFNMINLIRCKVVKFNECGIKSNKSEIMNYSDFCLFKLDESTEIIVKDCDIKNNITDYLTNDKAELKFINTDITVNKFTKGTYMQR
ncbi:MAG TPA: right-handed parallel beta-helix repeat-containing protein [Ignavibacteria bacterium]